MSESSVALTTRLLLRLFIPFGLGYYLSYLYRVVNAVIAPDLIRDVGLGPADLGLLTSAYFLTFALFQLPLGVLLDRMGPRRIEGVLLIFAGIGALVFALSYSTWGLVLGRGLIGFGVSACLMAAFKAFVDWVPAQRLPLANGVQMASGGLGALSATAPVELLMQVTDWRGLFLILALLSFAVAAVVWFAVPEHPERPPQSTLRGQLRGVGQIFASPVFWRIAPMAVLTQSGFIAIQSLWAGPWLRDVARMPRPEAANTLFLIASAMVVGFLSWGAITERVTRRGVSTATVAASGMSLFLGVQWLMLVVPVGWALPLWPLFGFLGTSGILSYAALSQSFPKALAGRVNTAINLLVFLAAFALQWAMGGVIGLWPEPPGGGYAVAAYHASFGMIAALQTVGAAWYWLYRRS